MLRSRLLIVGMAGASLDETGNGVWVPVSPCPLLPGDVDCLIDDVLHWSRDESGCGVGAGEASESGVGVVDRAAWLAYVAWIACTTLFSASFLSDVPVYNPDPLSCSKLLVRALEHDAARSSRHPCFAMVAWVLAARVADPSEQVAILAINSRETGGRKASQLCRVRLRLVVWISLYGDIHAVCVPP